MNKAQMISLVLIAAFRGLIMPMELGISKYPYLIKDVCISDKLAFVISGRHGLRIIDILNPRSPKEVGHFDSGAKSQAVSISSNLACVAQGSEGLDVLDIQDPSQPELLNTYYSVTEITGVAVTGNLAYITDHWERIASSGYFNALFN